MQQARITIDIQIDTESQGRAQQVARKVAQLLSDKSLDLVALGLSEEMEQDVIKMNLVSVK